MDYIYVSLSYCRFGIYADGVGVYTTRPDGTGVYLVNPTGATDISGDGGVGDDGPLITGSEPIPTATTTTTVPASAATMPNTTTSTAMTITMEMTSSPLALESVESPRPMESTIPPYQRDQAEVSQLANQSYFSPLLLFPQRVTLFF